MTLHLTTKQAIDGGNNQIPGGLRFNDESGAGAGPHDLAHVTIDSTGEEPLGTTADTAVTNPAVNAGVIALLKGVVSKLAGTLTVGSSDLDAMAAAITSSGVKFDPGQVAPLETAFEVLNAGSPPGAQKVFLPTDQPVANKLLSQDSGTTHSRIVAVTGTPVAHVLKSSAGNLTEIDLANTAAYDVFVKFYDAVAPVIGSDAPRWVVPIKAGASFSRSYRYGKRFLTAITYTITKQLPDTDATAVAANDVTGEIEWI